MKVFHFNEIGRVVICNVGVKNEGGAQNLATVLLFSLTADWFENRGG
jgi:hypothetical protein